METMNESIKEEFEQKIKTMEENSKKKTNLLNALCYIVSISLFVAVLVGTTISISNFINAKQQEENNARGAVIELKKVN